MKRLNVLITSVGRRNYIVEYFREALGSKGEVIVTNSVADSAGMYAARHRYVVPEWGSRDYVPRLLAICRKHSVRLMLSLMDQDSIVLSRARIRFEELGITVAISRPETLELTFDKLKSGRFLREQGIASPATVELRRDSVETIRKAGLRYPVLLKPRFGTGSLFTAVAESDDELRFLASRLSRQLPNSYLINTFIDGTPNRIVVQEFVEGVEFDLYVLNDFAGNYITTFVIRKNAMRSGETDSAGTTSSPELRALGKKLSDCLGHTGVMDVDLFRTGQGKYVVVDLNPRFGGGYPFIHVAGVDVPSCYLSWASGGNPRKEWLRMRRDVVSVKGLGILSQS